MRIRLATPDDAKALRAIYAPYVENTAITFEYSVPTATEFAGRIARILSRYPYLLAEEQGEAVGYAYASPFKERAAYDWAVETSLYVRQDMHGRGIGRALYTALEEGLRRQYVLNVNACIAFADPEDDYLTNASMRFHTHMGYRLVGRFHQCACKFDRWYDMIWMEKALGAHDTPPHPVVPLRQSTFSAETFF